MSDLTPAPVDGKALPPGGLRAARTLWITSFAAGLLALFSAFLVRTTQLEELRRQVAGLAPERDPQVLDAVTAVAFWGSLAALLIVIVVEAILLRAMMRQHGSARWALLVAVLVHCGAVLLVDALVVAPGDGAVMVRLFLVAGVLFAGVAVLVGFLPGSRAWFREPKTRSR